MKKVFNRHTLPLLAVLIIVGSCFGYAHYNQELWGATSPGTGKAAVQQKMPVQLADGTADNKQITKNETVYVKLTPAGEVKDTTVVSWLHFAGEVPGQVVDPVKLSQFKALNGAFKLENTAEGVRVSDLEASQHNVYYSGASDKKPPVKLAIDYYLDGQKISPAALAGKSGQVKMVFKLDNQLVKYAAIGYTDAAGSRATAGKDIYTPLATMISLELPAEHFSEVKTEEGMATAVGESMKINYILFPYPSTTATLTMQAEDFELAGIDIVVQPHMPPLLDLSSAEKLSDLQQGLTQLDQALARLEEGSDQLAGGQGKLVDGLKTLQAGTDQLIILNQAEEKIAQGALVISNLMINGVKPLVGNPVAPEQVKTLYAGLEKQNELLTTLVNGGQIDDNQVPPMSTTSTGLGQAKEGLDQLIKGGEESQAGLQTLHQGASDIRSQGISQLSAGVADSLNELRIGQGQISLMEQAVENYDSFLGKPAGSRGQVQFIYQCEAIK